VGELHDWRECEVSLSRVWGGPCGRTVVREIRRNSLIRVSEFSSEGDCGLGREGDSGREAVLTCKPDCLGPDFTGLSPISRSYEKSWGVLGSLKELEDQGANVRTAP